MLTGVSLTSEFENPGSRFSVFMDQELPRNRLVRRTDRSRASSIEERE
jgi:hypothetical protein